MAAAPPLLPLEAEPDSTFRPCTLSGPEPELGSELEFELGVPLTFSTVPPDEDVEDAPDADCVELDPSLLPEPDVSVPEDAPEELDAFEFPVVEPSPPEFEFAGSVLEPEAELPPLAGALPDDAFPELDPLSFVLPLDPPLPPLFPSPLLAGGDELPLEGGGLLLDGGGLLSFPPPPPPPPPLPPPPPPLPPPELGGGEDA